ncbi:SecDF P1 head subdomain-containing protein [Yinghuangia aomiensis]
MIVPRRRSRRTRRLAAAVLAAVLAGGSAAGCTHGRPERDDLPPRGLDIADVVFSPKSALSHRQLAKAAQTIRERAEAYGIRVQRTRIRNGAVVVRLSVRGLGTAAEERVARLGAPDSVVIRPVLATAGLPAGSVPAGAVLSGCRRAVRRDGLRQRRRPSPGRRPAARSAPGLRPGRQREVRARPARARRPPGVRCRRALPRTRHRRRWQILVALTPDGAERFADLTGRLADGGLPTARLAVVWRGAVVSAPVIRTRIASGEAVVSGNSPNAPRRNWPGSSPRARCRAGSR